MNNTPKKSASQDEITLFCFMGEALCKTQVLEQALSHSITLKMHSEVSKKEADEKLVKTQMYTLGKAIKLAEKEGLLPPSLQAKLYSFLDQRNWLVHKAMSESRQDSYIALTNLLFQKIKAISTEAENLQHAIELDMVNFCTSRGRDMSKVLAIMNAQYSEDEAK
jgi:uncharacterized protein YlaN (UPF0358 family)